MGANEFLIGALSCHVRVLTCSELFPRASLQLVARLMLSEG